MTLNDIPRPYAIVILVVLAGIFFLFLGMIIGNLLHLFSGNKQVQEPNKIIEYVDPVQEPVNKSSDNTSVIELYEVFLTMSTDKIEINQIKSILEDEGFKIKVTSLEKAGKYIYFLKIDALYEKEDATNLGNDIRLLYPEFSGYWLERVIIEQEPEINPEISEADTILKITGTTIKDSLVVEKNIEFPQNVDLFEMQIMANSNHSKIEEKSQLLEEAGFRTKIITAEVDSILYYRLRIDSLYTLTAGQIAGEKIVDQFDFIDGYWLERVKK